MEDSFYSVVIRVVFALTIFTILIAGACAQSSTVVVSDAFQNGGDPAFKTSEIRITGCVHNQTGVALENARVEARDFQTGALLASAYTNGNGVFELTGLGQGLYEMVAISGVDQARQSVAIRAEDTVVEFQIAVSAASGS